MNQASLFEPQGAEALGLLRRYVVEMEMCESRAERFRLRGLLSGMAMELRLAEAAFRDAMVFALLLDFEQAAGL